MLATMACSCRTALVSDHADQMQHFEISGIRQQYLPIEQVGLLEVARLVMLESQLKTSGDMGTHRQDALADNSLCILRNSSSHWPRSFWRNRRIDGYHGLSSRSAAAAPPIWRRADNAIHTAAPQCSSEMGHGGVHRNNQIETANDRGGVGHVVQFRGPRSTARSGYFSN